MDTIVDQNNHMTNDMCQVDLNISDEESGLASVEC